ncbi:MAG: hypothetical protein ACLP51_05990, partial [Syntrophobacteraceae bacterium]
GRCSTLQVRARSFVRAHPHYVRVRAYTLVRCSTLDPHIAQVRANIQNQAKCFKSGHDFL